MLQLVVAWLLAIHREERGSLFGDIADALRSVRDGVVRLANWANDTAWNAFQSVATNVWNSATHVAGTIWDGAQSVGSFVWNTGQNVREITWSAATHVAGTLWDAGQNLREITWSASQSIGSFIWNAATSVTSTIWDGATHVASTLWDAGQNVRTVIWDGATHVAGRLWDAGQNVREVIWSAAQSVAGKVWDVGQNVREGIWDSAAAITGSVKSVADAVDTAGEKVIDAGLKHKDEVIAALLLGPAGPVLIDALGGWEKLGDDVLGALKFAGKDAKSFGGSAFNQALDLFIGTGHIEPGEAPAQIAQALAIATAAGLAAQVPGLVQGVLPFENATATKSLGGFLAKFAGWDILIEAGLGAAVTLALKRPIEQHINKQTTTEIASGGVLDMLFARRKIDDTTLEEAHARHGYGGAWTAALKDAAYRPARVFELARIMALTDIDDATLQSTLEDAGYREQLIVPLKSALHATAKKTSTTKLVTEGAAALSDGFIDAAAFGAVCTAAGVAQDEQGILVLAAEMAYSNKVKTELLTAYRSRAAADALSDEELRAGLAGIGVTGAKADVEVTRANIARMKKPVDTAAAAQRKALNATRATLTTAYKDQFKKGLIDEAQLQAQLVFIGIPDFQASAIVELTKAEALKTPAAARGNTPAEVAARVQKDLEAAYITQFQHDTIDQGQLAAQLMAIGIGATEADAIVAREAAKKVPKPTTVKTVTPEMIAKQVHDTLAKAYEEQFLKGQISADELEQDFIAVGIDPEVARARRLLDEAKAAKKTTTAPASQTGA